MLATLRRRLFRRAFDRRPTTIRNASNSLCFRPGLSPLESRECPALWISTGDTNANNPANWDTGQVPGQGESADFDATSTVDCTGLAAETVNVLTGYTGTITLASSVTLNSLSLDAGSVIAPGPTSVIDLSLFDGSVEFHDTATLDNVIVFGGDVIVEGLATIGTLYMEGATGTISLVSGGTIRDAFMDSGVLDLGAAVTAGAVALAGGEITQAAGADLTVDGDVEGWLDPHFEWTAGSINSIGTLANVIITGLATTALIAPYNAGTVTTGSTLKFENGTTATVNPGTISFSNGADLEIGMASNVSFTGTEAQPVQLSNLIQGSQFVLKPGAGVIDAGAIRSDLPLRNDGATLRILGGVTASFGGRVDNQPNGPSVGQSAGWIIIENGCTLKATFGVSIGGGILSTKAISLSAPPPGEPAYTTIATIDGPMSVYGGSIIIGDNAPFEWPFGVPHVFGTLFVKGQVLWVGGDYKPVIDASTEGRSDQWLSTGKFTINSTPTTAPSFTPLTINIPPGGVAEGLSWPVIKSQDTIDQIAWPTINSSAVTYINVYGSPATWYLRSD